MFLSMTRQRNIKRAIKFMYSTVITAAVRT